MHVPDLFDKDAMLNQRAKLVSERDRLNDQIDKLDEFLLSMGMEAEKPTEKKTTITEAIRQTCKDLETEITKPIVLKKIENYNLGLVPDPATVAAILATMAKSDPPELYVEIKAAGRRGAEYGIKEPPKFILSEKEAEALLDTKKITGTGGWQSLFKKIQNNYDEDNYTLIFPKQLKRKISEYLHKYGGGGWQDTLKKIFLNHTPEIFSK